MNRIDHRPAVPASNGTDGGQLQRRMLQELERQWLDSWSAAASAAQTEPAPAAPEQEAPVARPSTPTAEAASASLRPGSTKAKAASATMGDRRPDSHKAAPLPPVAEQPSRRAPEPERAAQADRPTGHHSPTASPTADPTASALQAAVGAQALQPTGSAEIGQGASAVRPAMTSSTVAASPVAATMSVELGQAIATQPASPLPPADSSEPNASGAPAARPRLPQAPDGRLGPQRLTLRELAPDHVQASLRDTQLDTASSQLAAKGLARALMEAGYAQVNVVVNGRHSRGETRDPDDLGASTEPRAMPADSFTETAPKDTSHGN